MKLNRRSFFATAAAAPLAAKQAAASVLDYEGAQLRDYGLGHIGMQFRSSVDNDPPVDWLKSELKAALASRKEAASASSGYNHAKDLAAYIQIDNRRATSPAVRALLIAEERARRDKARELGYLDERIKRLKDQLGPLASLFED